MNVCYQMNEVLINCLLFCVICPCLLAPTSTLTMSIIIVALDVLQSKNAVAQGVLLSYHSLPIG